ncbi:Protein of unknown function with TPD sequence-motif [Pacmanvirus A23]|uniref:Protein of unknown function with TPD sequence-motif n=1 Tax=Pacmanvirus A23 TaxID=1932881 RepID=UPI000A0952F2|nr:Protein of unknown function with TPD sequence-motif [Pacmanvirus A23]SIP85766.1 Protein of unknown function with TPD sequence-motif [Pacmanvirus A23]
MDFNITVDEKDDKRIFKIIWANYPMDDRIYREIYQYIKKSTDYGPLNSKKIKEFEQYLTNLNKKYNCNSTIDQVISVRNIIIKEKIIKNYGRMNNQMHRISKKYDKGKDILTLSELYDFPPLNLLRGILIYKRYDVAKIYSIFANKENPEILLKGRDLKQYYLAEKNDAESTFNQQQIAKIAMKNENLVINFFKKLNIKMKSQDDLVDEQTKKYGRAVITPDLLFIDIVYINGIRIHWIDYKDYIGTNVRFLLSSNTNQAAKYNEKWGPGALCFHKSYVEGMIIPGTILLDARSLPIKLNSEY